jgi:tRNA A37 threonylcarbamoyladenosine biosynthesis protein TsaE
MIVAEWCEKIPFALPDSYYRVEILKKEANNRQISIELVEREI